MLVLEQLKQIFAHRLMASEREREGDSANLWAHVDTDTALIENTFRFNV